VLHDQVVAARPRGDHLARENVRVDDGQVVPRLQQGRNGRFACG
jgi:hypothetical protein